jgi:hypothetical protein
LKKLLTLTAFIEGATGLALLVSPSLVVSVLLDSSLVEPAGILVGRLTGASLLSLTIICWQYRNGEHHAKGVVKALLFYNVAAAGLLLYAGISGFSGLIFWAVSVLHVVMAVWCMNLVRQS